MHFFHMGTIHTFEDYTTKTYQNMYIYICIKKIYKYVNIYICINMYMYIYTHTLPTKPTKHDTQTCLITLSRWSRQSMCSRCLTNFFITLGWGNGWGNGWVLLWISLSLSLQFFLFLWLWLAPNLCNILGASPA